MTDLETSERAATAPLSEGAGNTTTADLSGDAVLTEPALAGDRPELADPVPAQLSTLSVAALRADLAETQRQVELISDAFAQAVDVISETMTPSESRIKESVVAAVTLESQAMRQALSADWSERAEVWSGQVDRRLADQVATLATAIDARWQELSERLLAEIRAVQASAPASTREPGDEGPEGADWERLAGELEARIQRHIERSLRTSESPAPAVDLAPLAAKFSTGIAELSGQITREIQAIVPTLSPVPDHTPAELEATFQGALSRHRQQAEQTLTAMESRLSEQLTLKITEQHQEVRQWIESRLDDLGGKLQGELDRLSSRGGQENLSTVDVEVVANAVRAIASELTDLRQQISQLANRPMPGPPAVDVGRIAESVSAAYEKLDQTVGERMNGLFEAVRDELTTMSDSRTRAIRRELDRVLYIATGLFGVLSGAFLWLLLRH